MLTLLTWALAALSLAGTWLNIKKNPTGFAIWMFTNIQWAAYDLSIHEYAQGFLFTVYAILAVYGYLEWRTVAGSAGA